MVSLEALVPADHFYRHLDAALDLSFIREWVQDLYADGGRPSIDPVVFFKLQLIMFFEGSRSERKLMETVALNLAHRWYIRYGLDEPLPDHSSLTRIRAQSRECPPYPASLDGAAAELMLGCWSPGGGRLPRADRESDSAR